MRHPARLAAVVVATFVLAACSNSERIVVAAGTTLVDSGLIDGLVARYESTHPGVELSVVGDSTAQVLALARGGAADVTITHAPDLEGQFVAEGLAAASEEVFVSRFVVVGPVDLRVAVVGMTVEEAFRHVADNHIPFVTRADGSGTNLVERSVWTALAIDPEGESWYTETGQGMGLTLQVADQRQAVTLAEVGTFLTASDRLSIVDLGVAPDGLVNPYRAMAVAGPHEEAAVRFLGWMVSHAGREALVSVQADLFGATSDLVFRPPGD